jgi:ATPase subunit of ABC transporter with duplicated ATPase domains
LALSLILKRVTKRYADNLIFENVFLELHARDRVGLLGRNGSGKTTLMKLLTKLEQPDAGEISASGRLAYLEQRSELEAGSLREIVLPERHRQLKAELETAQQKLEIPSTENLERFAIAEEAFRVAGGYDIEARAESILAGLGLNGDFSSQALSGGQERRALLARLLIEPSDFYLLDEPTNHLDLESLVWLEDFVNSSEAGFLIVSHDRAFLDATVTRCYELERGTLIEYPGNYSEATEVKRVLREAALIAFENHERKVKQLHIEAQLAAQQASRAENKHRVGSRDKTTASHLMNRATHKSGRRTLALEKRIEHMGELEKPFEENFMTRIKLGNLNHGPNEVLTLENLKLERGNKLILEGLNLHVRRGERLALVGANGGGKSTLLKAILGQLPISSGKIVTGIGLNIYWAGQNTEELDEFQTLKDALLAANPDLETRELFALLASLGLPKDPTRAIGTLSGGQRTRLSLARLSVTKAQLLILDEPTNNLDIDAIQALEKLLLEFTGTIIFASHDRKLLENVATKTLEIPSLKLEVHD